MSATSSSGGGKETDDALHNAAREAVDLSQEIIQIIVSTGPSGISRTFAAAQACSALGARSPSGSWDSTQTRGAVA
jgi:hypothetical protein